MVALNASLSGPEAYWMDDAVARPIGCKDALSRHECRISASLCKS